MGNRWPTPDTFVLSVPLRPQVPPGKTLVVKFADRAIASRAAAVNPAAYQPAGNGNGVFYM